MSYIKIGKYYGEDPSMSVYQVKEILDTDYLDITNVFHWFNLQTELGKDYLYCRTNAKLYINSIGGFSNLTDIDKMAAARHFCVAKTDIDTIFNTSEQEKNWQEYLIKSKQSREQRWMNARTYISFRITDIAYSNEIVTETDILNLRYINYGIETYANDLKVGILDWVNGTSDYSGSGFPSKPYFDVNIQQGIVNCFNGIYNI